MSESDPPQPPPEQTPQQAPQQPNQQAAEQPPHQPPASGTGGSLPPYASYQASSTARPATRRPGTVTGAAWTTIALSGISILCGIAGLIGASPFVDYMVEHPDEFELSASEIEEASFIKVFYIVTAIVLIAFAGFAIAMAICTLKRQNWARIILTVLSSFTILVGGLASILFAGIPWVIAGITVIVLLYVGGANAWFRGPMPAPQYGMPAPPYGMPAPPYGPPAPPYETSAPPYAQTNPYPGSPYPGNPYRGNPYPSSSTWGDPNSGPPPPDQPSQENRDADSQAPHYPPPPEHPPEQ